MKRVVFSVINDIVTDNRVHKMAVTLMEMGYEVMIIGRKLKHSLPVKRDYKIIRMNLLFTKKAIFYAAYNIRLFFLLLFTRIDVLVANDLDTLPANFLVSRIKRKSLIYDSHELFTEVPELIERKKIKKIWLKIEKFILPRLKYGITVTESIKDHYLKLYGLNMIVVRNLPNFIKNSDLPEQTSDGKTIIYQGALNMGRGIELAIKALKYMDTYKLIILGDGDITEKLKLLAIQEGVTDRVVFTGKIPFEEVIHYTRKSDIGFSIEEDLGLNYRYALPNKLFNYIQARIPAIVSDLPEMSKIITRYNTGKILEARDEKTLASLIESVLNDQKLIETYKRNCEKAARDLCWENEKQKVIELYSKFLEN